MQGVENKSIPKEVQIHFYAYLNLWNQTEFKLIHISLLRKLIFGFGEQKALFNKSIHLQWIWNKSRIPIGRNGRKNIQRRKILVWLNSPSFDEAWCMCWKKFGNF